MTPTPSPSEAIFYKFPITTVLPLVSVCNFQSFCLSMIHTYTIPCVFYLLHLPFTKLSYAYRRLIEGIAQRFIR